MRKKVHTKTIFIIIILCALFTLAAAYICLTAYFGKRFTPGVYVNGIYCTGKTPQEINALLVKDYDLGSPALNVRISESVSEVLDLSDIGWKADFLQELEELAEERKPYLWFAGLLHAEHYTLTAKVSYDQDKLAQKIAAMAFLNSDDLQKEQGVRITYSENGYVLYDYTKHLLDTQKASEEIAQAVFSGYDSVDLTRKDCYYDMELTAEIEKQYELWRKIENFQKFTMCYRFGDTLETVDPSVTGKWILTDEQNRIVTDENGNLILDKAAVETYIGMLAQKYDTYGVRRQYVTHDGKTVTIEGGTYGNLLNQKAETEYLIQAFLDHNTADREPVYIQKALYQGIDDIGPNYVEANLTEQKLYFIIDGEVLVETDVVSGNLSWNLPTPSMVCSIQGMYRNATLRGGGTPAFVYYWVPVFNGIGIHDATWRREFGGTIYQKNGSHGCINVPLEAMKQMYEMMERGMPVVCFYEGEGSPA